MAERPPQHSATAEITYIPEADPAWDRRYMRELDDLAAATGSNADHPMMLYVSGRSRFDLDAPGVIVTGEDEDGEPILGTAKARDYLKPGASPRTYHLRRLRAIETCRLEDVGGSTSEVFACQLTLRRIENPPAGLRLKVREQGITDAQLDEIRDAIGLDAVRQIGRAALRASSQPTEAEGKR